MHFCLSEWPLYELDSLKCFVFYFNHFISLSSQLCRGPEVNVVIPLRATLVLFVFSFVFFVLLWGETQCRTGSQRCVVFGWCYTAKIIQCTSTISLYQCSLFCAGLQQRRSFQSSQCLFNDGTSLKLLPYVVQPYDLKACGGQEVPVAFFSQK